MKQSLQAFMRGLIDYAGLFPPAKLPLDPAIRNYARYRLGSDAWMLSKFIIPASKLHELSVYKKDLFTQQPPFHFSILGSPSKTADQFEEQINKVLGPCAAFYKEHAGLVATPVMEIKLPEEAVYSHDADLLKQLMDEIAQQLARSNQTPSFVFYEGLLDESWKKNITAILEALSLHNQEMAPPTSTYRGAAFKIRCGGVEAALFPTVEQMTFMLNQARAFNVAFKCTAGLHHPVRHYADEVQTRMHGFFNVFGGALLGYAHDLDDEELEQILQEEDAEQFVFSEQEFRWKELAISTQEIKELRETALISYGSCSFDDPREDLTQLKLL